jgi:hypothetical protein
MSIVKPALQAFAQRRVKAFLKKRYQPKKFVGASEIGQCIRRIAFAKSNATVTENWGASQRGVTFEDHFWVPAMRAAYKKNLLYTGTQQRSLVLGNLRATPDGLLINQKRDALKHLGVDDIGPSREIVLDCKSLDPRINLATAKSEHEFQAQVQLALMGATTKHRPMYALISYVNASFFDDVVEFAIRYDAKVFEQARKRAAQALAKPPSELLPEGWIAGGDECKYCPFAEPCRQMRGDMPTKDVSGNLSKGILEMLAELARNERQWHAKASASEDEQRKIQHQIKELLRAHGLNRIEHDGITIVWSPVKGRPSLDMPALKSAAAKIGLDVQQFETVGQPTDRLTVTIKARVNQNKQSA